MYSLYAGLVTLPLTLVLYVGLIPPLGASGAALASSLSYLLSFLLISWYYRRITGRRVLPLLYPTRAELEDLRSLAGATRRSAGDVRQRMRMRLRLGRLRVPPDRDEGGS